MGPNGSGKTTLIKLLNGLLQPTEGKIFIDGKEPGVETKKIVSYLPDKFFVQEGMRIREIVSYYEDFYEDFKKDRAYRMLEDLGIDANMRYRSLSKGTKEKVQLILIMSRDASLYVLDEPIGGVDPAARDYILRTILTNYDQNASIIISTHLISDIENILDRAVFVKDGYVVLNKTTDEIRMEEHKSVDALFREVFRC